jgi:RNA polymerase sigma-70 factor, ECF subfamily
VCPLTDVLSGRAGTFGLRGDVRGRVGAAARSVQRAGTPRSSVAELDVGTLRLARAGDAKAQRRFVEHHARVVFHLLSRMLHPAGRGAMVEDLAQETMVRAVGALPRFEPSGAAKLSTWVLTIASRLALKELRRPRAAAATELDASTEHGPEHELRAHRMRDRLQAVVAGMSPELRAAFVLSGAHGLTPTEIAGALEIPVATVRTRLHRARTLVRDAWREEGEP